MGCRADIRLAEPQPPPRQGLRAHSRKRHRLALSRFGPTPNSPNIKSLIQKQGLLSQTLSDGQAAAMATQKETLLDILIRLFSDRLLAEARRGLPRSYLAQKDDPLERDDSTRKRILS